VDDRDQATALSSAVFVMPRRTTEWGDAAALWVTVAGWSAAARERYGAAWVVTPDVVGTPEVALGATDRAAAPVATRRTRDLVPPVVRTALKDVHRRRVARRFAVPAAGPWWGGRVEFVWQHHDLFHRAGEALADAAGCPLVSYVHAPQVWEAAKWGTRRPGWARWLERHGERPQLQRSDVVLCVSEEVAAATVLLGVDEARVLVSPMAVDPARFAATVSGAEVRARYGLDGCTVVGWTGSFRRFHGLEVLVEAFRIAHEARPRLRLMLVGEGPRRGETEALATRLGLGGAVVFTGAVPHRRVPEHVRAMDVAVVVARAGEDFHYSPLKMREYMAAGVPVVAPRLGEVDRSLDDGVDGALYDAGDVAALARHLVHLHDDPALRATIGTNGRSAVHRTGTWAVQLEGLVTSQPFLDAVARRAVSRP
jgi:glycosyltransferase involved in cell wall biosynthesis